MTLLLADDNYAVRKMIKDVLASPNNNFIECSNGEEAVKTYAKYLPDWVLMDIEMDVMDGITASKKIIEKYPRAKIVMLTQYNDKHLVRAALNAGAKDFILKENIIQLIDFLKTKTEMTTN
ncbi:MAG: response regulator transcription factor [Ignavibacteria bacterium]|nr:response regulator transcription factor [Ignavibacteria bacterium]